MDTAKPRFNMALETGSLVGAPPFEFQKVVLRNFPLKANFRALSRFCDKYLNLADEFAVFRPAMPFVLLSVVNYGKMSLEAGNLGWTSQNEILFAVPVEWYVRDPGGRLTFEGLAQVSPFIFVDDADSQIVGREVYGWPKVQGWFRPGIDPWDRHPLNHRALLSLGTNVFDAMFANRIPGPREILAIEEDAPPTFSVVPPQSDNILNPWVSIPKAIAGWGGIMATIAEMFTAPAFRGYTDLDRQPRPELIDGISDTLNLFTRTLLANTINLKQMRDAADPQHFCYQALTNAKMEISQIRRGGMLGDLALLRGDPTGGFRIRLNEYANQPIVDTLGLEVADRVEGAVSTVTLDPVMPFWQELDLTYCKGENICWRTKTSRWRNGEGERSPRATAPDVKTPSYNTMGSNGFEVATGPFTFPEATLRVLPLPADGKALAAFVDAYLNIADAPYRFEPWGDYVYMVITAYGGMVSRTADIGDWAHRQVDFAVPLRWFDRQGALLSCGFVSPFSFMDSDIGITTAREVNGWAVRKADIATSENSWLGQQGPFADVTPLVDIKTKVVAALNLDQKSELRTIVELVDGNLTSGRAPGHGRRRWDDHSSWKYVAETWGRPLKAELEQMAKAEVEAAPEFAALRALSVEILGNRVPINQISLKQFRDAEEVDKACYQALVCNELVIDRIWDMRELEDQTHVKIHRFPTLPIVETLGLRVQSSLLTDQGEVECLQPMRPFYMKVGLTSGPADVMWDTGTSAEENLVRTIRDADAAHSRPYRAYFQLGNEPGVGLGCVEKLDDRSLCMADSIAEKQARETDGLLSLADATASVRCEALQPQMVVHAMLSNNWENQGNVRGTQSNRDPTLPTFVIRRDSVGLGDETEGAAWELFPVTSKEHGASYPRLTFEFPYWSPWLPTGEPSEEELEAHANIGTGLEWALVKTGGKRP